MSGLAGIVKKNRLTLGGMGLFLSHFRAISCVFEHLSAIEKAPFEAFCIGFRAVGVTGWVTAKIGMITDRAMVGGQRRRLWSLMVEIVSALACFRPQSWNLAVIRRRVLA